MLNLLILQESPYNFFQDSFYDSFDPPHPDWFLWAGLVLFLVSWVWMCWIGSHPPPGAGSRFVPERFKEARARIATPPDARFREQEMALAFGDRFGVWPEPQKLVVAPSSGFTHAATIYVGPREAEQPGEPAHLSYRSV